MKVIFENKYIKSYKFNSKGEFKTFFSNQEVGKKLLIEEHSGEFWYCYVGYDSLTSNKLFAIGVDSDISQEDLSFLYWIKNNLMVFDNGNEVFIVNDKIRIIGRYTIVTPLIGFYITESNHLLVLEEAAMKLISENGKMVKNEQFNLLDDYYICNNRLHIKIDVVDKIIELS